MAISETFANQHVKEWIDAWNNHDIQKVLSLYYQWVQRVINDLKVILELCIGDGERGLCANPLATFVHFIL